MPAAEAINWHMIEITSIGRFWMLLLAFVVGGALGSFLNVVVYRVPRGMSLLYPGSRCPSCGHAIRWHDNLPIFGWIALGGRCRDCGGTISARYPIVELAIACASAYLCWRVALHATGSVDAEGTGVFEFRALPWVFWLLLVWTLALAALQELDGVPVSLGIVWGVTVVGWLAGAAWPQVRAGFGATSEAGLREGLLGSATGLWIAALAWPLWIGRSLANDRRAALAAAAVAIMTGAFVGPWAMAIVGLAAVCIQLALQIVEKLFARQTATSTVSLLSRVGGVVSLATSAVVYLLAQPTISDPSAENGELATLVVAGFLIAVLAAVGRLSLGRSAM
jgi:leader peptidase (prepilin peptidase)/N-methyltransferase